MQANEKVGKNNVFKLEFTLKVFFISLFLNSFNVNAESSKIKACNTAVDAGKGEVAVKLADEILAQEKSDHQATICKARALGVQGEYKSAQLVFEQAITSADKGFDKIVAYILQGNLHKKFNNSDAAMASYQKSLALSESTNNKQFSRINHNLMGDLHAKNNRLEASIKSYLAGAELANNDNERADSYERLAASHTALKQYDSAIEYQLKAVVMHKLSSSLDAYANASVALGQIQLKAKEVANAEKTFERLEKFSIDNGGAYYEAKAKFYLAKIKIAANDEVTAKALLAKAGTIAKKIGASDLNAEIETLSQQLEK